MRSWMPVGLALLTAPAEAKPSPVVVRLECFDAWKGHDLREAGGGPGGAQWNTEAVVCAVKLEPVEAPEVQSVRLRLRLGQDKTLTLVGELFVPAHPRQVPEAIATVAANEPGFFIPASLFTSALGPEVRQAGTGARVHRVRFLVTATGLDGRGRPVTTAQDEIRAEFAFGE